MDASPASKMSAAMTLERIGRSTNRRSTLFYVFRRGGTWRRNARSGDRGAFMHAGRR
jgi:hypothetical protein